MNIGLKVAEDSGGELPSTFLVHTQYKTWGQLRSFSQVPFKMNKLMRRVHKWTSVMSVVFLLIWIVSGCFYIVPLSVIQRIDRLFAGGDGARMVDDIFEAPPVKLTTTQECYRNHAVSIQDAILILEAKLGRTVLIVGCSIYPSSDRLVYSITLDNGECYIIDAVEGVPVKITQDRIEQLAIAAAPPDSSIVESTVVRERPYVYWGPIPAHRFVFNDASSTHVYISPTNGRVEVRTGRVKRLWNWMDNLHKFEFLLLIWDSRKIRAVTQLIILLIALVAITTGSYMALPVSARRFRSRAKAKSSHKA